MTLVDATTGEIVADCTAADARVLTEQIKTSVSTAWNLIAEAYTSRAWAALGYTGWDDYVAAEFGVSRLALPREERREVVASLRDAGLSTRAIAKAAGIDRKTVRRDLGQVGEMGPPEPTDASQAGGVIDKDDAPVVGEVYETVAPTPVVGMDGKTYQPKPKPTPTDDQQRAIDLDQANERDARRIRAVISGWRTLTALPTHPRRDGVIAKLIPADRDALARIEEQIHG